MVSMQIYFFILAILICTTKTNMATRNSSSFTESLNLFANDIFKAIATERTEENIIFSPASIQSCLALAYLGAEGKTAQQIHKGLQLPTKLNKSMVAESYSSFIKERFNTMQNEKEDTPKIRLANRLYVNQLLHISTQYNELATKSFGTKAIPTNFSNSIDASKSINTWVENETEGKIKYLIQPDSLASDTSVVLVNAIYFKAKWLKPFSKMLTSNSDFKMAGGKRVKVPMMYGDERLKYGNIENLDATVIELPYKDSDLLMMILLPNKDEGLLELEQKLEFTSFNQIENQMNVQHVDVFLPKFHIEFDIDLKEPLHKLGLTEMFTASADFSSLFTKKQSQKVDEVKHKAFIDVNEAGSEAAAATFMKITPMSLVLDQKRFNADHPFVFIIRDKQAIYFIGHVTKF